MVRRALVAVAVGVLCVPLTLLITIALSPLWSWIEAHFGVESMGHSGPANWCFLAVYFFCFVSVLAIIRKGAKGR